MEEDSDSSESTPPETNADSPEKPHDEKVIPAWSIPTRCVYVTHATAMKYRTIAIVTRLISKVIQRVIS